jgi:hypothetical protein
LEERFCVKFVKFFLYLVTPLGKKNHRRVTPFGEEKEEQGNPLGGRKTIAG